MFVISRNLCDNFSLHRHALSLMFGVKGRINRSSCGALHTLHKKNVLNIPLRSYDGLITIWHVLCVGQFL